MAVALAPPAIPARPLRLPALRDDLRLFDGPATADGAPSWTLYDPVRNRYFRIGRDAFELLARWHLGEPEAVLAALRAETTCAAGPAAVEDLARFLRANSLARIDGPEMTAALVRQAAAARPSRARWLLHNYLFVRIPLVRPDRFLDATLPLVRPLFTRTCCAVLAALGLLGIVLALRQWDVFVHTFLYFFSWEGLLWYGLALSFSKILHELGHAYAARRCGCRVPTMGVAFLVLWPVLYTDVSDAWRLASRRQRLLIGAAGMMVELGLAAVATLLWSFLPDGPLRSVAFLVATVTWVLTLTVNLSPFMRFDGYYLLSDAIGVQNLQDRSFALARWRLRRTVFGYDEPPPEPFPPWLRPGLVLFAYAAWIYRLVLFIGIALLVYHVFFKLLGIFLFVVEILWFIARPLANELREWWRRRHLIRPTPNLVATLAVLGAAVWFVATPWNTTVALPAVFRAADYAVLYPPVPARLVAVEAAEGQAVARGQRLFALSAPEVEFRIALAEREAAILQLRILRQAADPEELGRLQAVQQELAARLAALAGLAEQRRALELRAPLDGVVVDLNEIARPGLWVEPRLPLARVVDTRTGVVHGYVEGADRGRIAPGARAWFHPEDPLRPAIPVTVVRIADYNTRTLEAPELASTHGGAIAVRADAGGNLLPQKAVYRVILHPDAESAAPDQVIRGSVRVEGEALSHAERAWRAAAAVLIRESGF